MNDLKYLLSLIVATASLIILGFMAFNFVQKKGFGEVKIQYTSEVTNLDLHQR